ncbi:DDI2 [Branchiostoma lanceolatum]|uniref:DDI2 protein n=1 Tax=Branchiostoma lanceolatum TaxID=7740 RepID=A0A8J9VHN5_BRALA|nr:DDI2 [Branchiostoma lanceolatum]
MRTIVCVSNEPNHRDLPFGVFCFPHFGQHFPSAIMKLTVYTLDDNMFTLDVAAELELENFKALCEFECGGIPAREIAILNNGVPLRDDKKTLGAFGLKDGDVVVLQRMRNQQQTAPQAQPAATGGLPFPMFDFSNIQVPGASSSSSSSSQQASRSQRPPAAPQRPADEPAPPQLLEMLRNSPHDRSLLKERNPPLSEAVEAGDLGNITPPPLTCMHAYTDKHTHTHTLTLRYSLHDRSLLKERNPPLSEAVEAGDLAKFTEVLTQQRKERAEKEAQRIRLLTADPFDPEVQRLINEEIQQKNIEENMNVAMEEMPESFGQVVMLYIDCMVNGHPVKAFVDSGAQMTIMSKACAERCNIMRLVDKRWAGIAKGVGTQKIIGRVHVAQIQIRTAFLQSSFSVLEDQPMDMLLGLDMLRRHQCTIDLRKNVLLIGSCDTETPFLSEADLPECARLNRQISDSSLTDQEREDRALAEALAKSAEEAGPSGAAASSSNSVNGTTSAATPPAASGTAPKAPFPEEDIAKLVQLGFPRRQAIEELGRTNGNVDMATMALLARSLKF